MITQGIQTLLQVRPHDCIILIVITTSSVASSVAGHGISRMLHNELTHV